jgi:hypothetical protein
MILIVVIEWTVVNVNTKFEVMCIDTLMLSNGMLRLIIHHPELPNLVLGYHHSTGPRLIVTEWENELIHEKITWIHCWAEDHFKNVQGTVHTPSIRNRQMTDPTSDSFFDQFNTFHAILRAFYVVTTFSLIISTPPPPYHPFIHTINRDST